MRGNLRERGIEVGTLSLSYCFEFSQNSTSFPIYNVWKHCENVFYFFYKQPVEN